MPPSADYKSGNFIVGRRPQALQTEPGEPLARLSASKVYAFFRVRLADRTAHPGSGGFETTNDKGARVSRRGLNPSPRLYALTSFWRHTLCTTVSPARSRRSSSSSACGQAL